MNTVATNAVDSRRVIAVDPQVRQVALEAIITIG